MEITILAVHNEANEEQPAVFDGKQLLSGDVRRCDNFDAADSSHRLILNREAVREIFDFVEWDVGQRPDTRVEQGGILLGRRYFDAEKVIHFAVVTKALCAAHANASSGFLEMTRACWREMHDRKDEYNFASGEDAVIIGWFHTHPNLLSCRMSDTDRNTQSLFFNGENTYALVINPQRQLLNAFRAKGCFAAQAYLRLGVPERTEEKR